MGWLNRLGSAITSGGQRLGHAVHQAGDAAVRLIDHVAPVVERAAGKVANVAGTIAKGAAMAIPSHGIAGADDMMQLSMSRHIDPELRSIRCRTQDSCCHNHILKSTGKCVPGAMATTR